MASSLVNLQIHHSGNFVSDPDLRYANGLTCPQLATVDVDELHIMLFHKFARDLGFLEVDLFGCKVNKRGGYYILKTDADVLKFLNTLKGGDFVDVCIVHKISEPILVEDITELDPTIQTNGHDSGLNARADVSPPNNDINRTENDKDKGKGADINGEIEESDEGEGNNFSSYHLQTSESDFDEDFDDSEESDSLFDIDENIEECSNLEDDSTEIRQSKINKKKDAQVNVDEIPSGPVGIDSGFEDMHKNKRGK